MKQEYSRTAEGMAFLRAIEQHQPASRRIIADPFARAFLRHPVLRLAAKSPLLGRLALRLMDSRAPGAVEFLTIRPRLVDELAADLAARGLEQVVLLGAGFDTMAWRMRERLNGATIFEVDHPATQAAKREKLAQLELPANVRFVAVDFEREDFVEKLRAAGFDAQRRTFVSWLGVTYYLTAAAVARALHQIAALGGAGMELVFDYMLEEVVTGRSANAEALGKARFVARLGEPWLFGVEPEQLADYVSQFGFSLRKDFEATELQAKYAPRRRLPMTYVRIATCRRT